MRGGAKRGRRRQEVKGGGGREKEFAALLSKVKVCPELNRVGSPPMPGASHEYL